MCYLWPDTYWSSEQWIGLNLLAKREAQAVSKARERLVEPRAKSLSERVYVPLDQGILEERREPRVREHAAEKQVKPTMQEIFGPAGLLERCMIGGYEHRRAQRSEEHTSELQSRFDLVCRLL